MPISFSENRAAARQMLQADGRWQALELAWGCGEVCRRRERSVNQGLLELLVASPGGRRLAQLPFADKFRLFAELAIGRVRLHRLLGQHASGQQPQGSGASKTESTQTRPPSAKRPGAHLQTPVAVCYRHPAGE